MPERHRERARRWYRCKRGIWQSTAGPSCVPVLIGLALLVAGATSGDPIELLVGGLLSAAGLLLLTVTLRAGIGITDKGVLVRSSLGRSRWAAWPEIDHFEIITARHQKPGGKGATIAVMLVNQRPLLTGGCNYAPWDNWTESNRKILQNLLNALEDERARAQRPLHSGTDGNLLHLRRGLLPRHRQPPRHQLARRPHPRRRRAPLDPRHHLILIQPQIVILLLRRRGP
jgi:hypothetical protein